MLRCDGCFTRRSTTMIVSYKPFFGFLFALTLAVSGASHATDETKSPEAIPNTTRVSAEQVVELANRFPNLVIVDARKAEDRQSAGWIEGSVPLPNYDTTEQSLSKAIPDKSTPVLFYCNGVKCGRSVESASKALALGYKNIYWFRGGWEEWLEKKMPISHN